LLSKYKLGLLIILSSAIIFYLTLLWGIIFISVLAWFLLVLEIPSIIIDLIGKYLDISEYDCQGLSGGGRIIGYAERGIIFFAFLLIYLTPERNYFYLLNFLPLIIAGKGLFRFGSSKERACAEWYILGTFMSILLGAFLSWALFAFLLG